MKNHLILACLTASVSCAGAHLQAPPDLRTIAASDTVYLVHVVSVDKFTNFSVTEVLRGKPASQLVLNAHPLSAFDVDIVPNTDWILYRNAGGVKGCVGFIMEGDCEWVPVSANPANHDRLSGYRFSVSQIRDYLRDHPGNQ
jgi:hypothetical protein